MSKTYLKSSNEDITFHRKGLRESAYGFSVLFHSSFFYSQKHHELELKSCSLIKFILATGPNAVFSTFCVAASLINQECDGISSGSCNASIHYKQVRCRMSFCVHAHLLRNLSLCVLEWSFKTFPCLRCANAALWRGSFALSRAIAPRFSTLSIPFTASLHLGQRTGKWTLLSREANTY